MLVLPGTPGAPSPVPGCRTAFQDRPGNAQACSLVTKRFNDERLDGGKAAAAPELEAGDVGDNRVINSSPEGG